MNKNKKILGMVIIITSVLGFTTGTVYGNNHINYDDPDWECKKWIGIVELSKQHYPNFIEDTLTMAEKKCGFDVNELSISKDDTYNSELELRLQSEINSNQKMAQVVEDVINACNEKLLDKYNNTNEKLEKENEILQKALSKYRDT